MNLMQLTGRKNLLITLISSLLFGSSLSLILTELLITKFNINFLSFDMPGVSQKLAFSKTFDILDFIFAGILALFFFAINFYGKSILPKKADFPFADILLLIFSVTAFIQTHFLAFSSKQVLVMVAAFEALYFITGWFGKSFQLADLREKLSTSAGKLRLQNGIFLGFILTLLTNNLTTVPALSLVFLFITPLILLSVSGKKISSFFENFPGILLLTAVLFPTNMVQLTALLAVTGIISFLILKFRPGFFERSWYVNVLSPASIVFLAAFNPAFYVGNFDSVEEGFWLAWVQRLINGQSLYTDVAVYHSPLIPWGMYLFSKISGFNLYSERLFLHLLQVAGLIIYFFFAKKLIKNTAFSLLAFFIYMAVTFTLIRNNIEIRLGISLLSLLAFFGFMESKKLWKLALSGVFASLALMLSIESGLAVLLTLFFGLNVFSGSGFISAQRIKENLSLAGGVFVTLGLFGIYLLSTGALAGLLEQTTFYARAFSLGYFNTPIDRSVTHSYFHFDVFDEYLDSVTIFWEGTKLVIIGFLILGLYRFLTAQKSNLEINRALVTAFFGLILTRAALGRSDWYHLLFVLGVALVLFIYSLSKLYETQKALTLGLVLFLVLVVARPSVNNAFLNQQLFKYQSYGKVFGDYKAYYFERGSGALIGMEIDTQPMFELVEHIQLNSSKEEKIFVFPWNPEIYFYTDRTGATQFDTPYAFFSPEYQNRMIEQLKQNKPKFIVLNANQNFGGLTTGALENVSKYINDNYQREKTYGPFDLLIPK